MVTGQHTMNSSARNEQVWSLQALKGYLPLQSIETFHYSRAFQANLGINPLVAAAAPLFTLLAKLGRAHGYDDLHKLQRELIHEVRAFECNALAQHYNPNVIVAARYALVVALDETIYRTTWGKSQLWKNYSLTTFFYCNDNTQSYFFTFLETLLNAKATPLDLLEFSYLCLNLAFLGLHRQSANEFQHIQSISDRLFTKIQSHKKPRKAPVKSKPVLKPVAHNPSWWMLATVGIVLTLSVYFGFSYLVSSSTQPLYAKLEHIIDDTYEAIT